MTECLFSTPEAASPDCSTSVAPEPLIAIEASPLVPELAYTGSATAELAGLGMLLAFMGAAILATVRALR